MTSRHPRRVLYLAWSLPLAAAALGGLAVFLWTHPLPLPASVYVCLVFVACVLHRHGWLCLLPALLPVADRAAWTGQIFLTESDALVLAILLVLALRLAWRGAGSVGARPPRSGAELGFSLGVGRLLLLSLLAGSYLVSTDWTVFGEVWSGVSRPAGYFSPLNGPRLAKGFLFALLLLPFLWRALERDSQGALRALLVGLLTGLMLVALATVWERWLFVGLSNFSSDYRTTALFWEVNVGGAMLDAWLALTVPFLIWLALRTRQPGPAALLLLALALAGYAVFTTFSRGLYLGLAAGLAFMLVLMARQTLRVPGRLLPGPGWGLLLLGGVGLAALLPAVFASGGYRGLAATAAVAFLVYMSAPVAAVQPPRGWIAALLTLALGGLLSVGFMLLVPKGVYVIFGLSAALAICLLLAPPPARWRIDAGPLALGVVLWAALNAALVTAYWSEGAGAMTAALVVVVAFAFLLALRWQPAWCWRPSIPGALRVLIGLGGLLVLVLLTGTYFVQERFSTVAEDLAGRKLHWSLAASLPQTRMERVLGVGTGQFAQRYFWTVEDDQIPGTHQLVAERGQIVLRLGGPRHVLGSGELYRVTQKVPTSLRGPFSGYLRARAPDLKGGRVHLEICRKHLLYSGGCAARRVTVPGGGDWAEIPFTLDHGSLGGSGLIPRPAAFSIANATRGRSLEIAEVSISDANGRMLLRNSDFAAGSDFWFFSSDHHHLPWHAKNLWLHFYVEQGWFGVLAFSSLYLVALYRVCIAGAVFATWAPPLGGALTAFGVVGLFDSLVDAPRITLLLFCLLLLALGLKPSSRFRPR